MRFSIDHGVDMLCLISISEVGIPPWLLSIRGAFCQQLSEGAACIYIGVRLICPVQFVCPLSTILGFAKWIPVHDLCPQHLRSSYHGCKYRCSWYSNGRVQELCPQHTDTISRRGHEARLVCGKYCLLLLLKPSSINFEFDNDGDASSLEKLLTDLECCMLHLQWLVHSGPLCLLKSFGFFFVTTTNY